MTHKAPSLFDWAIVGPAIGDSFRKLDPRLMVKNPVMFVTMVGAVLTTGGIFTSPTGDLALVHSPFCQLCRSRCRRPWQGASGKLAQGAQRHHRAAVEEWPG